LDIFLNFNCKDTSLAVELKSKILSSKLRELIEKFLIFADIFSDFLTLMEQYTNKKTSSASMENISLLSDSLKHEIETNNISTVIESGTFKGLGSTKTIATVFEELGRTPDFYTLEASWINWKQAKMNLRKYSFVKPVWGKSVPYNEAVSFIKEDEVLKNHNNYPNIYIDGGNDPAAFYLKEISGEFGFSRFSIVNKILKRLEEFDRSKFYQGDDLLRKYLQRFKDRNPLILLDSCGGIGYLEFSILLEIMKDYPFYLILDDINHLKHFRSFEMIKDNPDFKIINLNKESGWVFAKKSR